MVTYIDPREWTEFPPNDDNAARLQKYESNRQLLEGEHSSLFCGNHSRFQKRQSELSKVINAVWDAKESEEALYVSTNYCKIASTLFANMLFGKPPKINIKGEDSVRQQHIDKMVEDNMLNVLNHQQEIEASSLGDAFYRVRWGDMVNWRNEGAIIEGIPADNVYAILNPANIKDNQGYCIVNQVEYNNADYLYKEIHLPYWIYYQLFEMDGNSIGNQVPLDTIPYYSSLLAVEVDGKTYSTDGPTLRYYTGYKGLLVEHVPNWTKPDRFYGISDYSKDIISNQAAINETKTGILRTCLKHMDPILAVPSDVFQFDEKTGNFYARREDLQAIGLNPEAPGDLPRYITWDAKLEAAVTNIESCFEAMMMSFGISPAIFGMDKYGLADSGTALKLRMTHTLMMVDQKRTYFDIALKNIMYAAQYLDGRHGSTQYVPLEVSITWPEVLPSDLKEQAEALTKMTNGSLMSVETAVGQIQELSGEALKGELDRINNDHIGAYITSVLNMLLGAGVIDNNTYAQMLNERTVSGLKIEATEEAEPEPDDE